jgi:mannose/cellobiose epimerase-like protein (N-acyl-D-glucosamine 2-epimerase family)
MKLQSITNYVLIISILYTGTINSDTLTTENTTKLTYTSSIWLKHVTKQLMPFWDDTSAKKGDDDTPFPTYRCRDKKAFGESGCDMSSGEYKTITDENAAYREKNNCDGPYEWFTGPHNELLNRKYIRMHSRQTFVYGVAFHFTGNPEYLKLAHRGVNWLMKYAIDPQNGSYTYLVNGKPDTDSSLRTSQDQSYTMIGLAFYYYLTRDEKVLKVLTQLKDKVKERYMSPQWEEGKLIRWMLKDNLESGCLSKIPAPDKGAKEQKELVAILDQVNAYMLLTTLSAPKKQTKEWLDDLYSMAQTIADRFYNDGIKYKNQKKTGIDPKVPTGMFAGCLAYNSHPNSGIDKENCDPCNHHTDFGHSIKSFWMLYLIGREKGDMSMEQFAIRGANTLFQKAYLDNGSWGRALYPVDKFNPDNPEFIVDRDKEWWIYAELDQMAATLSLREPETHIPRLNTTYNYWFNNFVDDNEEVLQWKYGNNDTSFTNNLIPKANLWKNGFHSMEHALVAYITTAGVNTDTVSLYYALVNKDTPQLQPYYFKANGELKEINKIEDRGVKYRKVKATFKDIR